MKIVLILPSLSSGGLEKVITELGWFFSKKSNVSVVLFCLSEGDLFYPLPESVRVIMPSFNIRNYPRYVFLIKLMVWLRKNLRRQRPDALLSFGGKFNSFVLISAYGLSCRCFISDRSRPSISYGRFLDWLNPIMYRSATGIIAQTSKAKEIIYSRTGHKQIHVIGNPLMKADCAAIKKENIILNVGRFIPSKNQELLLDYFAIINPEGWRLCYVGDGECLENVRLKAEKLGLMQKVEFAGVTKDIGEYYCKAKIFAFTSFSEGFPNALGEAMAAGLACISFDCEAGPSDLLTDGVNGYLVDLKDHNSYIEKLKCLIVDEKLREKFGENAALKVNEFDTDTIGEKYLSFLKGY